MQPQQAHHQVLLANTPTIAGYPAPMAPRPSLTGNMMQSVGRQPPLYPPQQQVVTQQQFPHQYTPYLPGQGTQMPINLMPNPAAAAQMMTSQLALQAQQPQLQAPQQAPLLRPGHNTMMVFTRQTGVGGVGDPVVSDGAEVAGELQSSSAASNSEEGLPAVQEKEVLMETGAVFFIDPVSSTSDQWSTAVMEEPHKAEPVPVETHDNGPASGPPGGNMLTSVEGSETEQNNLKNIMNGNVEEDPMLEADLSEEDKEEDMYSRIEPEPVVPEMSKYLTANEF